MLKNLKVSNLAIVERAEVEFGPGLNVITGETGAGKSVLMGALDLVLGGRAEASAVRDGAAEAEVEALFSDAEGRERLVRRTVTAEGRSRAWVDDESVSVAELRAMGHAFVDIHGPRANQRLLEEEFQRETLDGYGKVDRRAYGAAYARYTALASELKALREGPDAVDLDFLRFQVNELEEAGLSDDTAMRRLGTKYRETVLALGGSKSALEVFRQFRGRDPEISALLRQQDLV